MLFNFFFFKNFGLFSIGILILTIINFYFVYDIFIEKRKIAKKYSKTEHRINKLKGTAEIDHLTGVNNRRTFDINFDKIYKQAKIGNNPFFLVFFDIDHFKKFNDTYGHDAGDKVLQIFAKTVNSNIRKNDDIFFRYGGEEFVLISSNGIRGIIQEASFLTKKLKKAVELIRIPGLPKITCSMGVGFFEDGKTKEEILKEADDNVYRAKENGRNKIYITKEIVIT
ncbi:MAG: GGDEF domain-containing protein [bacterium]